jgi:UDP-N-acetylmuramoyl-tripeptide--D-alanyl-D-alanine ligase
MSILWTADEAAHATGGVAHGNWQVSGISIDTRSLTEGDLFVALKAARDGHEFVAHALQNRASAALVSKVPDGVSSDAPLLVVPDVLKALEDLARAARARSGAKIVAVTGSVGKTSTKEMLRVVLGRQGHVHAAEASYNNHWGVPLTLARMPKDTDFAVIEIGMNHPGEIAPLARIAAPDVAMITNVAAAHMAAFEDIQGIAREKASIFEGLVKNGVAVVNADLETSGILIDAAPAQVLRFGVHSAAEFQLTDVQITDSVTIISASLNGVPALFKLSTAGRHFAMNALGVLACVVALEADVGVAASDLALWVPPAGRGLREMLQLDRGDAELTLELIDDAYNANPTSLLAALEVLAASKPRDGIGAVPVGRRIAILSDMLELGEDAAAQHASFAICESLAQIDTLHCIGPLMQALYTALPEEKRGRWVNTAPELARKVHEIIDAGDVVLVKGSKGSHAALVVDALRKLGHRTSTHEEGRV